MSTWIASISAHHRRWFSPSPRSLSFYSDALVIARGPSVWWKRFKVGAASGTEIGLLDVHVTDEAMLAAGLDSVDSAAAQIMFDQARNSTAGDLAAAHPKNVMISMAELAGVHAIGMHPHAKLIVKRTDGSAVRLYCSARGPAFSARLNVFRNVLGERFTTEKIKG